MPGTAERGFWISRGIPQPFNKMFPEYLDLRWCRETASVNWIQRRLPLATCWLGDSFLSTFSVQRGRPHQRGTCGHCQCAVRIEGPSESRTKTPDVGGQFGRRWFSKRREHIPLTCCNSVDAWVPSNWPRTRWFDGCGCHPNLTRLVDRRAAYKILHSSLGPMFPCG